MSFHFDDRQRKSYHSLKSDPATYGAKYPRLRGGVSRFRRDVYTPVHRRRPRWIKKHLIFRRAKFNKMHVCHHAFFSDATIRVLGISPGLTPYEGFLTRQNLRVLPVNPLFWIEIHRLIKIFRKPRR